MTPNGAVLILVAVAVVLAFGVWYFGAFQPTQARRKQLINDPRAITEMVLTRMDAQTRDLRAMQTIERIRREVLPRIENPTTRQRLERFLDDLPLMVTLRAHGRRRAL